MVAWTNFPDVPRKARFVAVGVPHHITQRGSDRRDVFFHHRDRVAYLQTLFEHADRYGLAIWGYCLMSNHIHLIAVPVAENSMARAIGRTHADYARYANVIRRGCGHLWQARFYSCAMEESHCWQALCYIEQNPMRAGLVAEASDYCYSSARAHLENSYPEDLNFRARLGLSEWSKNFSASAWQQVLATSVADHAFCSRLHEATRRGLPMGSDQFRSRLERASGRDLEARLPGRPKRKPYTLVAAL